LENLSENLKEYVLKFQQQNDRLRVLCGKLLLEKCLINVMPKALHETIEYDQFKRPFISTEIDFNISHSGNFVICALTGFNTPKTSLINKIGIDVEKKREVKYEEFEKVFTSAELDVIKTSINPIDRFFEYWTMKEAVMKADGRGFHLSPLTFTVQQNCAIVGSKHWYLKRIFLDNDYDCHLATEYVNPKIELKEMVFL
jgi:4'-phosphopantetheinyl transferase